MNYRYLRRALIFCCLGLMSWGCNIEDTAAPTNQPSAGDACTQDGTRRGSLLCQGEMWVPADMLDMGVTADMPTTITDDGSADPPDGGVPPDGGTQGGDDMDDMCEPKSEGELCVMLQAQCGTTETTDGCGNQLMIDCGECPGGDECGMDNTCATCNPETDDELCMREGATCGTITVTDRCDMERTIGCGMCTGDDDICTAANACECQAEDDATFCGRLGAQCGSVTDRDNCGDERTVNCGRCDSGTCEPDNTCSVCKPETDSAFCARLNTDCGSVTGMDNCMKSRTVDCGGCSNDRTCDGSNQCVCPTPGCTNAECGPVSNACGNSNNCGTCGTGQMCDGTNTCVCQPKTDSQLCSDEGASCGTLTVTDNCGARRTITCGSCPSGDVCTANACCTPQSDSAFCSAQGAQCGSVTGTDNCGQSRTVSCGSCSNGETCSGNQCICPTPSCGSAQCGTVSNSCGSTKNCGSCSNGETCSNNQCVCPTPSCGSAQCGTVSNSCGSTNNCGSCSNAETCTSSNTCICPTPSCGSAQCGSVSNACGGSRNCGSCGANETCSNNQCQCVPETDAQLCSNAGATCGSITVTDRCGSSRTVSCGGCSGGNTCQNNSCVCPTPSCGSAQCGTVSNSCGNTRNCGSCGAGENCNSSNQCVCPTPSCSGKDCGTVSNACGNSRSCGTCNKGESCNSNNQCVCPTPSCGSRQCGSVSNLCGNTTSCGSCSFGETCNNGQCECVPESDSQLCLGRCGLITVTDRCGTLRSVSCNTICSSNECCDFRSNTCVLKSDPSQQCLLLQP